MLCIWQFELIYKDVSNMYWFIFVMHDWIGMMIIRIVFDKDIIVRPIMCFSFTSHNK